jgi:probable rRNA maturation factor
MRLEIITDATARVPRARLKKLFAMIVNEEAEPDWRAGINLVFTTDRRIRNLNRRYRNRDRSTDVLAFTIDSPSDPYNVFGEVYVSVATARRQAIDYGVPFSDECVRLVCHGLLHLFGYDHQKKQDACIMQRREADLLGPLGLR